MSEGSERATETEREAESESWREWSPLTPLLDQLPHHFQRGLSTSHLHLTCLAALPQHLLLGTNVGLVYLAHLPSLNLMRLKCENAVEGISCVAGVRTVEDMVAVGGTGGTITIFQLPRCDVTAAGISTGAANNNSGGGVSIGSLGIGVGSLIGGGGGGGLTHPSPQPHPPVKRFTVTSTHNTRITALSWSLNGLLLFSGDESGAVGLVEVDPTRCECTARPLHTEPSPIAQLSYLHQRLAVCTHERAIVYALSDGTHIQVGVKPRKHPGLFGCVWSPSAPKKSGLLFTSRPGLRLWAAEGGGEVLHTHIVRDLPVSAEAVILNPSTEATRDGEQFSFGLLHALGPNALVSHTRRWLVAFHTTQRRILTYTGRFRDISGVAVWDKQIFVLEGHRTVVCLSPHPPEYIGSCRVPRPPTLGLWELSQLGNKIVTQGSGLMDHLARVGSSVAAKVTEHAGPPVLTGHKGGRGAEGKGHEGREGREGKDGGKYQSSGNLVPSILHPSSSSSASPSRSSSSSSFSSSSSTPPSPHSTSTTATPDHSDNNNKIGSVEVVEAGGGGPDSLENCGPLVTREKTRRKRGRKNATTSSLDTHSSPPSSPHPPSLAPPPSTEDIHTNIQEKEILLADILDMDCLKLDHPPPPPLPDTSASSPPDPPEPPDTLPWGSEIGDSETQCSTPSTIKETSPAPNSATGDDFYARFYSRHLSLSSVESAEGPQCHPREEEEEEDDDIERLPSNFSEDRSSCLSYGPPSGSSLPSHPAPALPPHPPVPPLTPQLRQRQVVTLNDSSDIADITWSYPHEEEEEEEEEEEDGEVLCGGWVRRSSPGQAASLAASHTCRAFVNTSGHLYLAGGAAGDPWRKVTLTRAAQQVSLAPGGGVGWVVVEGGEGYAFVPPPMSAGPHTPTKMAAVARDVRQASVGEERTWYLDTHMQVCVCPSISEESITAYVSAGGGGGVEEMVQVVTRGQVVWGLTRSGQLLFRIGINPANNNSSNHNNNNNNNNTNTGQEWGMMAGPDPPQQGPPGTPIVGVALGAGGLGWVVDRRGRLFFREGVCDAYPQGQDLRWWQVETSQYMVGEEVAVGGVLLAASEKGVWLAEAGAQTCCVHTPPITGHWWDVFSEEVWSVVCAEGLYTTQGTLCCLSPLGQLFLVNPNTSSTVPLDPPPLPPSPSSTDSSVVVSVSQRPEVLWVVTADGRVFIRAGLSASSLIGTHWDELDLTQIGDIQLCHISCGTEVVWGVDTKGGVYMRQGPLTPCLTQALPPAWIQVEPSVGTHVEFTKVFVGARLHLVWALDTCLRVYVRQAIFPELPVGLSWVLVPGLAATHLSISEDQVVALTPRGEVFRRTGVSANNFIGDAWVRVPGRLAGLSVTTDNTLWGLNACGHLCKHHSREVDCFTTSSTNEDLSTDSDPTTTITTAERLHTISLSSETEDWEVL